MEALDRMVRVGRALRLNRVAQYAPTSVLAWYNQWKARREIFKDGKRLVPEAELEESYTQALQLLKSRNVELGDYLEFGVYCGASLACMYRTLQRERISQVRLFGFDSFQGFPDAAKDDDGGAWAPGDYKFDYNSTRRFLTMSGVDWSRVFLEKGWFNDTLTDDLLKKHEIHKASLIMMDCDLYTSSRDALRFCAPLIRDSAVIFFDDWNAGDLAKKELGQKRAFDEFLKENPHFTYEELDSYTARADGWPDHAKVFLVSDARH
jgi:O-methyltransferase